MSFNYLQTDDRDDYLAQFDSRPKTNLIISFTLVNQEGEIVLFMVPREKIRDYAKKNFLPIGKSAKKIWRKLLEEKGFTVVNNYMKGDNK